MQSNYNINQLSLTMATDYQPEENHPAYYIHQLVENLAISKPNIMGRSREYDQTGLQLRHCFLSEN